MKKFLVFFIVLVAFFVLKAEAYQMSTDVKTKRIPVGTKLEVAMANDITQENVTNGDMFSAYLTRDVRTQTTMILPKGTIVRGNVSKVINPKILYRPGVIYVTFDHVVAPNGAQIPVQAGIAGNLSLNDEGGITGSSSYKGKVKQNWTHAGNIIKKATKWGIKSGEELFKGGKFLITPFSSIGGVFAGGGYFAGTSIIDIFRKGESVQIKKGKVYTIMLLQPLDVPVNE